jgi:hypothetical protein
MSMLKQLNLHVEGNEVILSSEYEYELSYADA